MKYRILSLDTGDLGLPLYTRQEALIVMGFLSSLGMSTMAQPVDEEKIEVFQTE